MAKDNENLHTKHRERMRQRIARNGIDSLQDHEVLEYLLYPFIPRKDTNPIAHRLLDLAGNLENVFNSTVEMLMSIQNMTYSASLFLTCMPNIIQRYNLQKLGEKPYLRTSGDAMEYFKNIITDDIHEHFYIAIVAPDGRILDTCDVTDSSDTDQCKLDIKKLVLKTSSTKARDFFIAHNHPSGDKKPSITDFEFTKWLVSVAVSLNLQLVDHIIVAKNGCYSFRRDGLLASYAADYSKFCKFTPVNEKYK